MGNQKDIRLNDEARRSNMNCRWLYSSKAKGGWGLTLVVGMIEARRLSLLCKHLVQSEQAQHHGWIKLTQNTAQIAQQDGLIHMTTSCSGPHVPYIIKSLRETGPSSPGVARYVDTLAEPKLDAEATFHAHFHTGQASGLQ